MTKRLAIFIFLILLILTPTGSGFSQTPDSYSDFQVSRIAWGVVADLYLGGRNNTTSLSVLRDIVVDYWEDNITHATNNNYTHLVSQYKRARDQHLSLLDINIKQTQATEVAVAKMTLNVIHQVIMAGADNVDPAAPSGPNPVVQNFAKNVHSDQVTQNIQHTLNGQLVNRIPESGALINVASPASYNFMAGLPPASAPPVAKNNQAPSPTETPAIVVQPTETSSSSSIANADLLPNIYKPVRFTNSGIEAVTVHPETYTPNPEVALEGRSNASTVVFPGSNPTAYLSLPQGTYTFCYDWELDGDQDGDGYIDYAHKSTEQVSLGESSPDDIDFATMVNLSPKANTNPNGKCSESAPEVAGNLTPEERANQGAFYYTANCVDSDGEAYTESDSFSSKFVNNGVILSNPESGDSLLAQKTSLNTYKYSGEGTVMRLTYKIEGFDFFSGGEEWFTNCNAIRGD